MSKKNGRVNILGIGFDKDTENKMLEKIGKMVKDKGQHYIVTPNPEIVMAAQEDKKLRRVLNKADLVIPDGVGIIWASRILYGIGGKIFKRIAGVDLMEKICCLAARRGWSVFFLGARRGVAGKCARELRDRYPGLLVAGTYSGRAGPGYDRGIREKILDLIGEKKIDFLFVAYGGGRQERWIVRNLSKLPVKIAMGVGGSFDFISGRVKRAPKWMQEFGLEWFWRLVYQPWRWRRQLALSSFILAVFKAKLHFFSSIPNNQRTCSLR